MGRKTKQVENNKSRGTKKFIVEVASEKQAKCYNSRRRPISYEIGGKQILRSEKTSNKANDIAKKLNTNSKVNFLSKQKFYQQYTR